MSVRQPEAGDLAIAGALVVIGALAALAAGASVLATIAGTAVVLVVALFGVTLFALRASPDEGAAQMEEKAMTPSNKRFADLSPDEARKVISAGVAIGVLQAGLLLLLLAFAAGFILGALRAVD